MYTSSVGIPLCRERRSKRCHQRVARITRYLSHNHIRGDYSATNGLRPYTAEGGAVRSGGHGAVDRNERDWERTQETNRYTLTSGRMLLTIGTEIFTLASAVSTFQSMYIRITNLNNVVEKPL